MLFYCFAVESDGGVMVLGCVLAEHFCAVGVPVAVAVGFERFNAELYGFDGACLGGLGDAKKGLLHLVCLMTGTGRLVVFYYDTKVCIIFIGTNANAIFYKKYIKRD